MFRTVSAQPSRCLKKVWYEVWTLKIITGKSLFLVLFCFSTHCQALCPHKHEYSAHTGVVHSQVWSHVAQVTALGVQRPLLVRGTAFSQSRPALFYFAYLFFLCYRTLFFCLILRHLALSYFFPVITVTRCLLQQRHFPSFVRSVST